MPLATCHNDVLNSENCFAEWGSGWQGGTNFLVEVEETAAMSPNAARGSNSSSNASVDYNAELANSQETDPTGTATTGTNNGTTLETG